MWGFNTRGQTLADSVYLLQEKDYDAINYGMKGAEQNNYVEISYEYLYPTDKDGGFGKSPEADKIIMLIREALSDLKCREIKYQ